MKNILRYLLLALVVIGFTVPVFGKAEAAKIAILPLANNVADNELSSQVFFNECMDYFKFPEFDMVDDAVLDKALKEENYAAVGKNGPDEAMLKRIMAKTGADMALMMSLDELSLEPQMGMIEDYYKFKIKARITGWPPGRSQKTVLTMRNWLNILSSPVLIMNTMNSVTM